MAGGAAGLLSLSGHPSCNREVNSQWSMVNVEYNTVIIMATTEVQLVTRTLPITH